MSDMTPEMLEDCVEGHAEWYCEDVAFEPYIAAWRTDRRTIDVLAAALRAAVYLNDTVSDVGPHHPFATAALDAYDAALEPARAWLAEANTDQ